MIPPFFPTTVAGCVTFGTTTVALGCVVVKLRSLTLPPLPPTHLEELVAAVEAENLLADIPDPLLEEFEKLEREVRLKAQIVKQSQCPHLTVHRMEEVGGALYHRCADCGALTDHRY